ncbi:MAG: hypothetical protein J6X16_08165 [Bacteroidales bacterium]|nr:hypothetical protein [Bacteroidales bacterium]
MPKKRYTNKEESTPKVAEPSISYGHDMDRSGKTLSSDATSCNNLEESDRMSVDEYFDEVWSMVLKKHDSIVATLGQVESAEEGPDSCYDKLKAEADEIFGQKERMPVEEYFGKLRYMVNAHYEIM